MPEDIERIKPLLGHETFAAGTRVIVEGEPNDRIYFILEGKALVTRRGIPLLELGEGETFGEMEILDVMPSAATVTVTVPLSAATISNRAVHEIFRLDSRIFALFIMNLARDLSRRLRRMDGIVTEEK